MSWEALGAIAGVIATILAFISILIQVKGDKQKEIQKNVKPIENVKPKENDVNNVPSNLPIRRRGYSYRNPSYPVETPGLDLFSANYQSPIEESTPEPKEEEPHNPYAPYLYFSVGLIGACGGVASILVPWLLIQGTTGLECLLFPSLILGVIGGVIFALFIDNHFQMNKAKAYLRFPLCIFSGLIGGWLGLLVIIVTFIILGMTGQGGGGGYIERGGDNE